MVQCLSAGDGEQSCLHSRHAVTPLCGCDSPLAGLLNISWSSPVERATNHLDFSKITQTNQPRPDELNRALLSWEIVCKGFKEQRKSVRGSHPFHKAWKKNEKEWDLIKCVSLWKNLSFKHKMKTRLSDCPSHLTEFEMASLKPCLWARHRFLFLPPVCICSSVDVNQLRLLLRGKVPNLLLPTGKAVLPEQSEEQKYWSCKNCCYY